LRARPSMLFNRSSAMGLFLSVSRWTDHGHETMHIAKRRPCQHIIDQEGQQLLREKLPKPWIIREYRPDYGLDFSVEVFKTLESAEGKRPMYETLGEHFFVQLKSIDDPDIKPLDIFRRGNVEKAREKLDRDNKAATIDTYRFSLETTELVTVERMGIAVPVLLVIADLNARRCSFVCLNDYIDKILIPRHDDYRSKEHRTVHVPVANEVGSARGQVALRWYAKRAKLLAAFQRFTYQFAELQWSSGGNWEKIARYFGGRVAEYDFWDDTEMCAPIPYHANCLRRFLAEGRPYYIQPEDELFSAFPGEDEVYWKRMDIFEFWRSLALLPQTYEDVWREWFLPSALGHVAF